MILRKTVLILASLAMLAASFALPSTQRIQAQTQEPDVRLLFETIIPDSIDTKYPHVIAIRDLVMVGGSANRTSAFVWSKTALGRNFGSPFALGPANGQPDYSSTAIGRGFNDQIWAAWIDQPTKRVWVRQFVDGTWGPGRVIDSGAPFPVTPSIGISGDGTIMVAWRVPDQPISYRISTDGGNNWSPRAFVSGLEAYGSQFTVAGGPGSNLAISYTAGEAGLLQIFAAFWTGTGFRNERVSPRDSNYADSSMTFLRNGTAIVAYRGVEETGRNSGVLYHERQPDGTWPRSQIVPGRVVGNVSVNADEGDNLHFSWTAQPRGGNELYATFKPAAAGPFAPIASSNRGALFNSRGYGSIDDGAYNHVVAEEFTGVGLRTRYALFQGRALIFGGNPTIERRLQARTPDNTITVTFTNIQGSPNQVRYSWNTPPTDATPWVAFRSTMAIPVPTELFDNTTCLPSTIYTQLRNSTTNQIEPEPRSATVELDGVVEVNVQLQNPFTVTSQEAELARVAGAPAGAPLHTRVPLIYLNVTPESDCNGLTSMGIGSSREQMEATYLLEEDGYEGIVALPNLRNLREGPVPFVVRVNDGAGNSRFFDYSAFFDETPPILNPELGTVTASASSKGDLLQDLSFNEIQVVDQAGTGAGFRDAEGRQFWGLWIANSLDPLDDPINAPGLNWLVVTPPPGMTNRTTNRSTFTIRDWSLASGLSEQALREDRIREGDDFETLIYVRFLDGAGNPSNEYLTITVAGSELVRPRTVMPLVSR
ncbi:MAG: sialidase family protein [Oscillochloridaceae bacterium umkhey_bin13]